MRLISLTLTNYRRFQDVFVDFPDGVTAITGHNGSGKSSLMEAVAWTIYGTSRSAKEEIISFGGGNDYCQSVLRLELDSKQYEVVRVIGGANLTSKMSVFTVEEGGKVTAAKGVKPSEQYLKRLIGLDQHSFETSFFAKQHQLNALSNLQSAARKQRIIKMLKIDIIDKAKDLLKKDISSIKNKSEGMETALTDTNVLEAQIIEIEKDMKTLKKTVVAHTVKAKEARGRFKQLSKELEETNRLKEAYFELRNDYQKAASEEKMLTENISQLEKEVADLALAKKEYKKIEPKLKEIGELEKKLQTLEKQKSLFQQYLLNKQRYESYFKDFKNAEQKCKSLLIKQKDLELISGQLKELDFIEEKSAACQKDSEALAELTAEIRLAGQSITDIEKHLNNLEELKGVDKCPTCLGPVKGRLPEIKNHFESEKNALIAKKSNLEKTQGRLQKELSVNKKELQARSQKRDSLRVMRDEFAGELKALEQYKKEQAEAEINISKLKPLIENTPEYSEVSHKEIKSLWEASSEISKQAIVMKTKISGLEATNRKIEQNKKKLDSILKELKVIETKGKSVKFDKEKAAMLQKDFDESLKLVSQSELNLKEAQMTLENREKDKERLVNEVRSLEDKKKAIKELQDKGKNLQQLAVVFDDFKKELIGRIRPSLSEKASFLLTQMTDGRYNRLELTPDYDIAIYDGNTRFEIDRFSGGEKDLANLCLRLAISELMAESSRSDFNFIILDEVFGSQDSLRKNNIVQALQALSKRFRQLFIITHVEDVKGMVDSIIEVKEKDESRSTLSVT